MILLNSQQILDLNNLYLNLAISAKKWKYFDFEYMSLNRKLIAKL